MTLQPVCTPNNGICARAAGWVAALIGHPKSPPIAQIYEIKRAVQGPCSSALLREEALHVLCITP